jgi:hypothetical protein
VTQQVVKVFDGFLQADLQRNPGVPVEFLSCQGDVRLALRRVIRGKRIEDDFRT